MKRFDFGNARLLLAMENPIIRQGLQTALQSAGFNRAIEVATLERLVATLVEGRFDVILTTSELGIDSVTPFLTQLRQGGLVHHPLPIIVAFLSNTDDATVRKVIDSGPDDLLQTPIVPGQLLSRLAVLAEKRKTFVVTSDYVGPDRRTGLRPGALDVPLLDVPNPLALRAARLPEDQVQNAIVTATERLRAMRLARYVFELQWLLRAIRGLFEQGSSDQAKLFSFCERIKTLLQGLPRLLPNAISDEMSAQVERLEMGSNILIKNRFSADPTVLLGVTKLIRTLVSGLRELLPADLAETTQPQLSAATT